MLTSFTLLLHHFVRVVCLDGRARPPSTPVYSPNKIFDSRVSGSPALTIQKIKGIPRSAKAA
jgi:hypothetical protein